MAKQKQNNQVEEITTLIRRFHSMSRTLKEAKEGLEEIQEEVEILLSAVEQDIQKE